MSPFACLSSTHTKSFSELATRDSRIGIKLHKMNMKNILKYHLDMDVNILVNELPFMSPSTHFTSGFTSSAYIISNSNNINSMTLHYLIQLHTKWRYSHTIVSVLTSS